MPGTIAKQAAVARSARVQNASTQQTVKATAAILWRVVVANAHATTTGTLTLVDDDGASPVTKHIIRVPAGQTVTAEYGIAFASSLKVTPSIVDLDACIVYD